LTFGIGSTLGPAVAAPLMQLVQPQILFVFLAGVYTLIAVYALWRIHKRDAVTDDHVHQTFDRLDTMQGAMQGATQETMYLDPRTEADAAQT
jgi:uncharacterized membrane protein YfcA